MSYNTKYKVLHVCWSNLWYQYRLGDEGIGKNTGILVDKKWDMVQHCVLTAQKVKCILSFWDFPPQLHSGERRRLQGDPIAAFEYLKGVCKKSEKRCFSRACSDRKRNKDFKLKEGSFRPNIRKQFFTTRTVKRGARLLRDCW